MVGRSIGNFQIIEKLGAGGMGVVYRARDTRLDRVVALKVLGESLVGDQKARARLIREARTASLLKHPNICTIYEVGEADGEVYVAMEEVEGLPLSAQIPADGLPVEQVLRYGTQLADALAHAHARDIAHRDLKSSNVVVTPDGRVEVLDFGLAAKIVRAGAEMATVNAGSLTEAGAAAGTLSYMAPEVLQGKAADERTDLWALGVVLYEMASGKLPFRGRTGHEVAGAILKEDPAPLISRIPAGLRSIIQRCLAKEPGQRYQAAGEVRAALGALMSHETASAAPLPEKRPGWRRARRAALGFVAALGAVALAVLLMQPSANGPEVPVVSTGAPASANPEANEHFERAMLFMNIQFDLPRARQMLERALEIDPRFAEARAWYGFTHLLMIDGGFSNDTTWLYKGEEQIRQALKDDPRCGRAHSALAGVYFYQGRKELMPEQLEKARAANARDVDVPMWLSAYHVMSDDYESARGLLVELMARDPLFNPARLNYADWLRQQGDYRGAIRETEKVLDQDPNLLYGYLHQAWARAALGDLREAREVLERIPAGSRSNFQARLFWSLQLALEGRRDDALRELDAGVLKYAEVNPYLAVMVAECYSVLGQGDQALDWLERAVRLGDDRVTMFRSNPMLAAIRGEPRFAQVLESITHRRRR